MDSIRECSISDCHAKIHAHGYCQKHMLRWKKHGDPNYVWTPPKPDPCTECDAPADGGKGFCKRHYRAQYRRPEKPCASDGCDELAKARGLCSKHYARAVRSELGTGRPEQFHDIDPVAKITLRIEVGLCWIWQRKVNNKGYGVTSYRGRQWYVHRLLWTELVGPIPSDMVLDHLCRNPPCCNPDHLEVVTQRENMRRSRGDVKGRYA